MGKETAVATHSSPNACTYMCNVEKHLRRWNSRVGNFDLRHLRHRMSSSTYNKQDGTNRTRFTRDPPQLTAAATRNRRKWVYRTTQQRGTSRQDTTCSSASSQVPTRLLARPLSLSITMTSSLRIGSASLVPLSPGERQGLRRYPPTTMG